MSLCHWVVVLLYLSFYLLLYLLLYLLVLLLYLYVVVSLYSCFVVLWACKISLVFIVSQVLLYLERIVEQKCHSHWLDVIFFQMSDNWPVHGSERANCTLKGSLSRMFLIRCSSFSNVQQLIGTWIMVDHKVEVAFHCGRGSWLGAILIQMPSN